MILLETSALVALVTEAGRHPDLERVVREAETFAIPAHCLLEAHMVAMGRFGPGAAEAIRAYVAALEAEIIAFSPAQADIARTAFDVHGKGRHPAGLNFGDCMSYAAAKESGLPLLYLGDDFAKTDLVAA